MTTQVTTGSVTSELSPVTTEIATSETSPEPVTFETSSEFEAVTFETSRAEPVTPETRPATTEAVTFDLATAEPESNINVGLVVGVVMGVCVTLLVVTVAIVLIVITRRKAVRLRSSTPQKAAEEIDARHNTTQNLHDEVKIDTKPPPASEPDTALSIPVQANAAYIPTPSIPTEVNAAYIPTPSIPTEVNAAYIPTPSIPTDAAYIPTPSISTEANAAYISTGTEEMSLNELYATPGGGNSSVQQLDYDYVLP